jgi:hypothetical protein
VSIKLLARPHFFSGLKNPDTAILRCLKEFLIKLNARAAEVLHAHKKAGAGKTPAPA